MDPTPALIQGSAVLGIIGLTLTWYGGMSKYAGFYDTALARRQVFWGIPIGGVAAVKLDLGSFQPQYRILTGGTTEDVRFNLFEYVLVIAVITAVFHFMLRRESVRTSRAEPTSGWALGAGRLRSFRFIVRRFEVHDTFELDAHGLILIASVLLAAGPDPEIGGDSRSMAWIRHPGGIRGACLPSRLAPESHVAPHPLKRSCFRCMAGSSSSCSCCSDRERPREPGSGRGPEEARRRLRRIWADARDRIGLRTQSSQRKLNSPTSTEALSGPDLNHLHGQLPILFRSDPFDGRGLLFLRTRTTDTETSDSFRSPTPSEDEASGGIKVLSAQGPSKVIGITTVLGLVALFLVSPGAQSAFGQVWGYAVDYVEGADISAWNIRSRRPTHWSVRHHGRMKSVNRGRFVRPFLSRSMSGPAMTMRT